MPTEETGFERKTAVPPPRVTLRGTLHALVVVSAWILFGYWWGIVLPRVRPEDAAAALLLISISTLVTAVLTSAWVRHNLAIFRRKGPRTGLPAVSESVVADAVGRRIVRPADDSLKRARYVTVSTSGRVKTIEPAAGN